MRISDWSSDVCSSDLQNALRPRRRPRRRRRGGRLVRLGREPLLLGPEAQHRRRGTGDVSVTEPSPLGGEGCESLRSEEHTSELQSLMRISYAVFCLKKKKTEPNRPESTEHHQYY